MNAHSIRNRGILTSQLLEAQVRRANIQEGLSDQRDGPN
jgi:hypothetical protein